MPDDRLPQHDPSAFRRAPPAAIGSFGVRAASNELIADDGEVIRLRPRLMDVLLRLAAAPGEVVTRQALLDDVWPRRVVADEVLSRAIAELRTALHDDARESRYIETLPKIGYRLVAPVAQASNDERYHRDVKAPLAHAEPEPAGVAADTGPAVASRSRGRRMSLAAAIAAGCVFVVVAAAVEWTRHAHAPTFDERVASLSRQLNGAVDFSSDVDLELSPHFSPDGKKVAFVLGDYDGGRIVLQDVATRTRVVFGDKDTAYLSPVWFPDGERLAYYRHASSTCAIVERDLVHGTERVLVDCERKPGARFDLARDGRRLVYSSDRDGDAGLRMLDIATGRTTTLTAPDKDAGIDWFPRFSPDGRRVAFTRGVHAQTDVWVVPVDEPSAVHAVGSPRGLVLGIAWLDNDGPLVVAANWFGFRSLVMLDIAKGKSVLAGGRNAQFPDVGPHGELVYESATYIANLQLLDTDDPAQPPRPLWPATRYTNYPEYSPDGQRLAFLSNRDNVSSLFVGAPGGGMQRLPLPADHVFARPHWSHDGRALYAVRSSDDALDPNQQGVRIDPQTGRADVIDALGDRVADVRDTDDGATLYFATVSGPLMQLWRAPVAQPAQRERLPLPLVETFDLVGRTLAYSEPNVADITVCTLPDLRCAGAGLPMASKQRMGWALAADALWVSDTDETAGELLRFDLSRREVTARLPYAPTAIGPNLAIAPDQRHAVISRAERPAIDLMLAPAR